MMIFWLALTFAVGTLVYLLWEDWRGGFKVQAFKVLGTASILLCFYYGAFALGWKLVHACWRFIVIGWLLTQ